MKAYRCSDKFRVNANGKRIDVWLIYRCIDCDNSWNFGIFERCNRRDIEHALLAALESNDPALARRHAFDVVALKPGQPRRGVSRCRRSQTPARRRRPTRSRA
ncbi:DUF1062 domain-containing protein [Mesorhizobium sp. LNJC403B00]|uniref:DUF1062 domain-containing protein n=1 Tax=Mesorhizobium sp. LNJC403B00 TaxID=1287280 RepID=UPI0004159CC4|nr:DUF1062 domain-containing protein [Mesorhizobium sp. LNJC403B00]